jgi:tetratricopeptide (TPR) repeat protein
MKTKFLFISLLFLIQAVFTAGLFGQTIEEFIDEGDKYYKEFNNVKALEVFQKADVEFPDNWEIMWRISRCYVDIGEHMPTSTSEQEDEQFAKYQLALEYADKAVSLAPDQSVTYLRRAIANGRIALFQGVFSVADVVEMVRLDCEKSIELNNGGDDIQGVTHYVLGRTHDKISDKWAPARGVLGLGWADIDSALVHYEKAAQLKPNFVMIYLDYAKANIEEGEYEKARELLNKAIKSPNEDEDDEIKKTEARGLLEEIKDE